MILKAIASNLILQLLYKVFSVFQKKEKRSSVACIRQGEWKVLTLELEFRSSESKFKATIVSSFRKI